MKIGANKLLKTIETKYNSNIAGNFEYRLKQVGNREKSFEMPSKLNVF